MLNFTATCDQYGVGEVSAECTEGFPSLFRIDKLAETDNTKLETRDRRQVLIPDINFACNGSITRWIFGAKWEGNFPARTELQVWRRTPGTENTYTKVNATIVMVDTENDSEVYEYLLETPLAFHEGDIFGYFQPNKEMSELNLYLEKSGRLVTYHILVESNVFDSAAVFTIDSTTYYTDTRYPLMAVRTGKKSLGS